MPKLKLGDKELDVDKLPADAKAEAQMLILAEQEIGRLKSQLAIVQTARNAYVKALAELIAKGEQNDTIRFN